MKITKILIIIIFPAFLLTGKTAVAQDIKDTIITKKNEKIVCKVIKITDTDIEYKKDNDPDAIIYVISKDKVREIRLAKGEVIKIMRDEMDMNQEAEIIDKRSAIKFHFFSPINSHLAFTYEKSIKMGTNVEATVGFINNSMFNFGVESHNKLTQGAFVVLGPKFNLGHSYYIKGMKYSHPLKGKYFKPEIIFTSFVVRGVDYYNYIYYSSNNLKSDLYVNSVSVILNYGNQYILGNILTFGFNIGVGYCFVDTKYSNSEVEKLVAQRDNYYNDGYSSNLYSQQRISSGVPISLKGNLTIGYIFK